jgi:CheY-like chemotaxis protein
VRQALTTILEDGGYEVIIADDGLRSIAAFGSGQPDLVITDIIMPEQEGIRTIAKLQQPQHASLRARVQRTPNSTQNVEEAFRGRRRNYCRSGCSEVTPQTK